MSDYIPPDSDDVIDTSSDFDDSGTFEASDQLVEQVSDAVVTKLAARASFFSGPLPPPDILEGYERVRPGAADILFTMLKEQQAHRHEMEKQDQAHTYALENKEQEYNQQITNKIHRSETNNRLWGLAANWSIAVGGLLISGWLLAIGRNIEALAPVILALTPLAIRVYRSQQAEKGDREVKKVDVKDVTVKP